MTKKNNSDNQIPFFSEQRLAKLPPVNVARLATKAPQEPEIPCGIDLSGRPKIVMAAGRGKTGKTSLLRWIAERSIRNGSEPILADIDPSNASFSQYFENVLAPKSDSPPIVAEWLQRFIDRCTEKKCSAIIDLGGGDTTLRTLAEQMPNLNEMMESEGVSPVLFYLLGPQPDDMAPALALGARGFRPKAQALVLNEYAVDIGKQASEAFSWLTDSEDAQQLLEASIRIWMPKLFSAEAVEARRSHYYDASEGRIEHPLSMIERARLKAWLESMNRRFSGIESWIP